MEYLKKIYSNKYKRLPKYSNGQDILLNKKYGNLQEDLLGTATPKKNPLNANAIGAAGSMVGAALSNEFEKNSYGAISRDAYGVTYQDRNEGNAAAAGALDWGSKGLAASASMGFADFGLTAAAGAIYGGISGYFNAEEENKKNARQKADANNRYTNDVFSQGTQRYNNLVASGFNNQGVATQTMYKKGGVINLYPKGGRFKPKRNSNPDNEIKLSYNKFDNPSTKENVLDKFKLTDGRVNKSIQDLKFTSDRFNISGKKTLLRDRGVDFYLAGNAGFDKTITSDNYFYSDESTREEIGKRMTKEFPNVPFLGNGFDKRDSYVRKNPVTTSIKPNFNLAVGAKTEENNDKLIDFNSGLEVGGNYSNNKLLPYFNINADATLNINNRRKNNLGYLSAGIDTKYRLGDIEDNSDLTYERDGVIKEVRAGAPEHGKNEMNTKSSYFNLNAKIGKRFNNGTFIEGGYKKNLNTGDDVYEATIGKKFANGGKTPKQKETYNTQRATELGYTFDKTGHMPSVDETNGMWLKSKKHPTAWMELMEYSLNPELQKTLKHPVINQEGYFGNNQLQYLPKKAQGGNVEPEYEVEGDEIIQGQGVNLEGQEQVASDVHKAIGATHEEGGVKGAGGERVFSNRLYPTPMLHSYLSANKIKINKNDTYANIAEKVGRKKGKFESKTNSTDPLAYKTGLKMVERFDSILESTFQDQEMLKEITGQQNPQDAFAGGGDLPKDSTAVKLPPKLDKLNLDNFKPQGYNELDNFFRETARGSNKSSESFETSEINYNPNLDPSLFKKNSYKETAFSKSFRKVLKPDHLGIKIMNAFLAKGYSPNFAAGIIGNWQAESSLRPDNEEVKPNRYGTRGYGLAQWTDTPNSPRRTQLENFAKSQGKKPSDVDVQLKFFFKELEENKEFKENFNKFNSAKTPREAALLFHNIYERSADTAVQAQRRLDYADTIYDYFMNNELPKNQYGGYLPTYAKGGKLKKYSFGDKLKKGLEAGYDSGYITPEQGINFGLYLANNRNANKQRTGITRQTARPTYVENVNLLPYAKYNISKEAKNQQEGINRSSSNIQDIYGRRADITARSMDAINSATATQANADNSVRNTNTQIANNYLSQLTANANEDAMDRVMGENAILANKRNSANTFVQGVMGNLATNRQYQVEQDKLSIAAMDGSRGTSYRSAKVAYETAKSPQMKKHYKALIDAHDRGEINLDEKEKEPFYLKPNNPNLNIPKVGSSLKYGEYKRGGNIKRYC